MEQARPVYPLYQPLQGSRKQESACSGIYIPYYFSARVYILHNISKFTFIYGRLFYISHLQRMYQPYHLSSLRLVSNTNASYIYD